MKRKDLTRTENIIYWSILSLLTGIFSLGVYDSIVTNHPLMVFFYAAVIYSLWRDR